MYNYIKKTLCFPNFLDCFFFFFIAFVHLVICITNVFQRTRIHEAENWFLRAKKLAPSDASVYKHFGWYIFYKIHFIIIIILYHLLKKKFENSS